MIIEWKSQERRYQVDLKAGTFTKTEIRSWPDFFGETQRPWKSRERLKNEYYTLELITSKTKIPVPKPIRIEYDVDGCLAITTELIKDCVRFDQLSPEVRSQSKLEDFVHNVLLPQLRTLRSTSLGAIIGEALPPRRVFERQSPPDHDEEWFPLQFNADATEQVQQQQYPFCHNDLGQHNFLCDPMTGEIRAVIDWEYAGFYLSDFEAQLWRAPYDRTEDDPLEIERLLGYLNKNCKRRETRAESELVKQEHALSFLRLEMH